jgi:hypothetical protein
MIFNKMKTYNLGKLTYTRYVFFFGGGDIYFTYQFLEDQKVKQERSCKFLKKISDLSVLTPDVRSYPVLRYFTGGAELGIEPGPVVETKRERERGGGGAKADVASSSSLNLSAICVLYLPYHILFLVQSQINY